MNLTKFFTSEKCLDVDLTLFDAKEEYENFFIYYEKTKRLQPVVLSKFLVKLFKTENESLIQRYFTDYELTSIQKFNRIVNSNANKYVLAEILIEKIKEEENVYKNEVGVAIELPIYKF